MTPTQAARFLRILGRRDDDPLFSVEVFEIVETTDTPAALTRWREQLRNDAFEERRKAEEAQRTAKQYEAAANFVESLLLIGE